MECLKKLGLVRTRDLKPEDLSGDNLEKWLTAHGATHVDTHSFHLEIDNNNIVNGLEVWKLPSGQFVTSLTGRSFEITTGHWRPVMYYGETFKTQADLNVYEQGLGIGKPR